MLADRGEVAAQHDGCRVERVDQHGRAGTEPARDLRQGVEGAGVAEVGPSVELGQPLVDVQRRVLHRVVRVRGTVEQCPEADDRLPAADPAAAAAAALRFHDHVTELAGVPLTTAEQPAVGHDAAAHADPAEEHQDVLPLRVAGRGLGEGGQVALVVDGDRVRRTEARPDEVTDRHVVPAEVGAKGHQVTLAVDQAGRSDGEADGRRASALEVHLDLAYQLGQPVQDLCGGERGDVEAELVLADHRAAEVERHRPDVVDVDLRADTGHGVTVELHVGAGTTDRAALDSAGADQSALGQFGDLCGHRRPGQPQLGGERGPGPGAVIAQLTQDSAEVGVDGRHGRTPTLLASDWHHSFVRTEHKLEGRSTIAQEHSA